ncbi:MAG: hypothetical protein SGJ16_12445 [Nitrospirota bacterium]|nr:hypothetical protein [Nitrospirota bacterium]
MKIATGGTARLSQIATTEKQPGDRPAEHVGAQARRTRVALVHLAYLVLSGSIKHARQTR